MTTLNLNINEAFKLRNKMKAKISALQFSLERACLYVDPDMPDEDAFRAFDGEKFDVVVQKTEKLMEALCSLNTAIDKANIENRLNLNKLETTKVKESLNKKILDSIRNEDVYVTEVNSVTGEKTKIRLKPIFDDKEVYIQKEKAFAKEKKELEDTISLTNSKINFTYEIDESVYESIFA